MPRRNNQWENKLYYGDNLDVLRKYLTPESVDLIYLDPPFNSKRDYNLLFAEPTGETSQAQVKAFSDFWRWDEASECALRGIAQSAPPKVTDLVNALVGSLGRNNETAYLVMMTIRMVELHRVLKPTGSFYLHCDPSMSHYIKIILDQIFGPQRFRREIVWRSGWVSGFKTAAKNWIRNHDLLLYYTKSQHFTFNKIFQPHPKGYKRRGGGENPQGVPLDDVWTDIYSPYILSFSKEKLGYETQKPLALLERIITASSNPNDIVLDPFCGCGTAVAAAEKLSRKWIGIDITHLAIALIKFRLRDAFGSGIQFQVIGEPQDVAGAEELAQKDRYQFQWWALSLVQARPVDEERKKGADEGIDGVLYFLDNPQEPPKKVVVQVKSGHVGVRDIREFSHVIKHSGAVMGLFITLQKSTSQMRQVIVAGGKYGSPLWDKSYPRIQIRTIEELLSGKRFELPPTNLTFKRAQEEEIAVEERSGRLFTFDEPSDESSSTP